LTGDTLPRASQLYAIERTAVDSPFVADVWRARGVSAYGFISVAAAHWEIVVTRDRGRTSLTVRGPETTATAIPITTGEGEFFGIEFRLGSFMPGFPPGRLTDRSLTLPRAGDDSFWLNGAAWQFPRLEDADVFVRRLEREGLIVRDPLVEASLRDEPNPAECSIRSVERRLLRATGLTRTAIGMIERAGRAVELIECGLPLAVAAARAGYADQAHMTRALRRLVGQTPGQVARGVPPA
jgi:AraC-like DNA-binding protein